VGAIADLLVPTAGGGIAWWAYLGGFVGVLVTPAAPAPAGELPPLLRGRRSLRPYARWAPNRTLTKEAL
jgi:hypothetical protein